MTLPTLCAGVLRAAPVRAKRPGIVAAANCHNLCRRMHRLCVKLGQSKIKCLAKKLLCNGCCLSHNEPCWT